MNTKKIPSLALLLVGVLAFSSAFAFQAYAYSTAGATFAGFAWSDTIGWLDMSGVAVDASTGNISGYAWSDNIGWVSFNTSDVGACPQAPCQAKLTATGLQGFAKALAGGTPQSGGWDGYISLNDPSIARTSDTAFSGYAWGSEVVGWLSLAGNLASGIPGVTLVPTGPSCTSLPLNGVGYPAPDNTGLAADIAYTYSSVDTAAKCEFKCTSSTAWDSTTSACVTCGGTGCTNNLCNNGATNPPACDTFLPSCTSLTVNKDEINAGETVALSWVCQDAGACTFAAVPNGDGFSTGGAAVGTDNTVTPSAPSGPVTYAMTCSSETFIFPTITVRVPDVSVTATPSRVRQGGSVSIAGTASNVVGCLIKDSRGNTIQPYSLANASGHWSKSSSVIVGEQTTYTMTCGSVSDSVIVNVLPIYEEF